MWESERFSPLTRLNKPVGDYFRTAQCHPHAHFVLDAVARHWPNSASLDDWPKLTWEVGENVASGNLEHGYFRKTVKELAAGEKLCCCRAKELDRP